MIEIAPADLEQLVAGIFATLGAPASDAGAVAHHLVGANLAGHDSHGVLRIPNYVKMMREGQIRPGSEVTIDRETPTTAVVDGGRNFGQVSACTAARLAVEKARAHDVGMVTLHNCNHVGRLGAYVEQIAAEGLIGMAAINNAGPGHVMAAFGGIEPRMSPNPVAFAMATGDDRPFVVDMSSSVVAEGKIRTRLNAGLSVPQGWAVKPDGEPVTEPEEFYGPPRGAVLPLGGDMGYKGFALALMVEVLTGGLSAGEMSNPDPVSPNFSNALWITAVRIEAFTDPETVRSKLQSLLDYVIQPPYAAGVEEILTPGVPEQRSRRRRTEGVHLDDETWCQIDQIARELGVAVS